MEDAVRALQQQVNALMSQNATLEAQLISQQNMAQGLAELPGAITTVLNRGQGCLLIRKAWEATSVLGQRRRLLYVWAKKVENYVSGVFPNVRGALTFCSGVAGRGHSDSSCARCA